MTHLDAMRCVCDIQRVRVWSRNKLKAEGFAGRASARFKCQIDVADSARAAVEGAHIVCTVTASRSPVLFGEWLAPGTHVNAVGAALPTARELDTEAVRRAVVYVDRRESALAESGDVLIPISEGVITAEHIRGELGQLLVGAVPSPAPGGHVTLFKSLGIAIEDLASAQHLYKRATATDAGTWVNIGGLRHHDA
jgi:ornithine cyclodeaminase